MGTAFPSQPGNMVDSGPCQNCLALTPDDNNDLVNFARGLYVGVGGDIVIDTPGGQTAVKLVAVVQGSVLPVCVKRLRATGTTASSLVALW